MSHFNFVIPLNRDDLFEAAARDQYTVENVYNTRDLKIKLQVGGCSGSWNIFLQCKFLGLHHQCSAARGAVCPV